MTDSRLPTYYISHGGGPWPWVEGLDVAFAELARSLAAMPAEIGTTPNAVLAISAHWETPDFTVQTHPSPPMLYDYGGFPPHTYQIQYPAPGSPEVAARIRQLLNAAGVEVSSDDERGFDHGTFVPLAVMYPDADVPVLQLSIKNNYDVADHLELGRALAPLRSEGVLIVASGFSYHNLRAMGSGGEAPSAEFDAWLNDALTRPTPSDRIQALLQWDRAPAARLAHPAEDHLVPLFVAVGAAEAEPATRTYHQTDLMGAITASSYRFG